MITRRSAEVGMATLTALFGLATMIGAAEYGIGWSPSGPQPGTFPFAIGLLIALASIGNALTKPAWSEVPVIVNVASMSRRPYAAHVAPNRPPGSRRGPALPTRTARVM